MVLTELVAEIGAKVKDGEFADAKAAIEGLGKIFEKVVDTIEAGIDKAFETVDKVGEQADALGRLSETLGISADVLQSLGGAAALAADIPWDTFTGGMSKLAIASAKAAEGAEEAVKAFGKVKLKGANGELKATDELLLDLADDFEKTKNPALRLERAVALLGRTAGPAMAAFLAKGSANIKKLQKAYEESGAAISQDQLEAAEKLSTANHMLEFSTKGMMNAFANPVSIEALARLREALARLERMPGVHVFLDKLGKSFAWVLDQLAAFLEASAKWLTEGQHQAQIIDLITSAAMMLGAAFAYVSASAIAAAATTFGPWILAAGLLILAFDDLRGYFNGKDSLFGRLVEWSHDRLLDPNENLLVRFLAAVVTGLDKIITGMPKAIEQLKALKTYLESLPASTFAKIQSAGDSVDTAIFGMTAKQMDDAVLNLIKFRRTTAPDAGMSDAGSTGSPIGKYLDAPTAPWAVTINVNGNGLDAGQVAEEVDRRLKGEIGKASRGAK